MVRVEVPARRYKAFLEAWPRPAWAWAEIVPGRQYRVHHEPWEILKALEAEKLLAKVKELLAKN